MHQAEGSICNKLTDLQKNDKKSQLLQCSVINVVTDYDRFLQDLTGGEAKLGQEGLFTSGHGAKSCREG